MKKILPRRSYLFGALLVGFVLFTGISLAGASSTVSNKSITMIEDLGSKTIPLSATGSRGEEFTFSIVKNPAHGTAVINGKTAVYTAESNYNGSDTFEYQAIGSINGVSNIGTVSIAITPKNDVPVAVSGLVLTTTKNVSVSGVVSGTDVDGDTLTCSTGITANGFVTMDSATCAATFVPENNFVGDASFNFRVFDGSAYSAYATVNISVAASNVAPTANDQTITTFEDSSKTITLQADDADHDDLSFRVATEPMHGTIVVNANQATYTPAANYNGTDSFQFVANDGLVDSNIATVTATVNAVNDAPVVSDMSYTVAKNQRLEVTLLATDAEGEAITYGVSSSPTNGRIETIAANAIEYLPFEDFVGTDSFQFWASDGKAYPRGTITIEVIDSTSSTPGAVGQVVWEYDFGSAIISGAPAFDAANHIYFAAFENATEVYMMDRFGQLVNRLDTGTRVEAAPMVMGDQLILNTLGTASFATSEPAEELLGGVTLAERLGTMSIGLNSDGTFNADRVWGNRSETNGRDGSPGRNEDGSIVYAADVYRIGTNSGIPRLTSINGVTGETLQAVEISGWSYASPLFLPNKETVSAKDGLVVVGPEVDDHDDSVGGFGGLGGSGVLVAFGVDEQGVMTETPVWSIPSESAFDRGAIAATVNGETALFSGTQNGVFMRVNPADGSVVWSVDTGGTGFGTMTMGQDNHTVYALVGNTSTFPVENPIYSSVIAFDGETGDQLWTHSITNKSSTAVVGDRGIYVVGTDEVLALNEQGVELWNVQLDDNETPYYGYSNMMPGTGLLVFGAGNKMMAIQTESTGPSTISDWPSYRATPDNSGIPQ